MELPAVDGLVEGGAAGCRQQRDPLAADSPRCRPLRLAELALEAGIPAGVLNVVPRRRPGGRTGAGLLHGRGLPWRSPVSTATGKRFMEHSGQSNLKQVRLERRQVAADHFGRLPPTWTAPPWRRLHRHLQQPGEVSIAGSRLYAQAGIYDTFVSKVEACARDAVGQSADPASRRWAPWSMKGRWRACWNMSKAAGAKARGCAWRRNACAPTAAATTSGPTPSSNARGPT